MKYVFIFLSFALSGFLSWIIIPKILIVAYKKNLFDLPDKRKTHQNAIPRLGGISFLPSLLISLFVILALYYRLGYVVIDKQIMYIVPELCSLIAGLFLLYLMGVCDDLIGMPYRSKFVLQFIIASLIPLSGLWINHLYGLFGLHEIPFWLGIPFTILLTIFIVNAINLIDGIDGLASGLSMVALTVFGVLYLEKDLWVYSILAFSMLGILLPFFYFNVFGKVELHEKIFMGDTGSLTLGYVLAFLAIRYASVNTELFSVSEGAIVIAFSTLIIPMFDVLHVMYVRWKNKTGLFNADRNHIHHRLIEMGLSFHQAMIIIIILSGSIAMCNILLAPFMDNHFLFFSDILLWIGFNIVISQITSRRKRKLIDVY